MYFLHKLYDSSSNEGSYAPCATAALFMKLPKHDPSGIKDSVGKMQDRGQFEVLSGETREAEPHLPS